MGLRAQSLSLVMLSLLFLIKIEGNSTPQEVHENGTSISPWLTQKDENQLVICTGRPFICNRGEFPPRFICCGNRCVDVTSDRNNCGLCGVTCMFNRQCCNRFCVNTNLNIFNCGGCGRACPFGRLCIFGVCAFEQPQPVSPVPFPPSSPQIKPAPVSPLNPPKSSQPEPVSAPPLHPPKPPKPQPVAPSPLYPPKSPQRKPVPISPTYPPKSQPKPVSASPLLPPVPQ